MARLVGWLSGRMNPDPRNKTRKARLCPRFSRFLAISRGFTIAKSRHHFSFAFLFLSIFFLCSLFSVFLSILVYAASFSFSFGTSTLLQPDFFLGNVSKTIGGPRIIARANQSRIEFRDFRLYEPSSPQGAGKRGTCEKEKRGRRGTK